MYAQRKNIKKQDGLERKATYSINFIREMTEDVLFVRNKKSAIIELDGDAIYGNSERYQTFFAKGCSCVKCGLEAKFFAKERNSTSERYHLNLYGYDESGGEILFTKDHIVPKSKGGKDNIDNYQTMCKVCNELKADNSEN